MDNLDTGLTIASASAVIKTVIGLIKMGTDPPRWCAPFLALTLGPAAVLLVMIAQGTVMTPVTFAAGILMGITAGSGAIGMAAIQDGERHDIGGGIRP